jgi:hypothetical protein
MPDLLTFRLQRLRGAWLERAGGMVVATLHKCDRQPIPIAGRNGTEEKVHPADCPLLLRRISPPKSVSKGMNLEENVRGN